MKSLLDTDHIGREPRFNPGFSRVSRRRYEMANSSAMLRGIIHVCSLLDFVRIAAALAVEYAS